MLTPERKLQGAESGAEVQQLVVMKEEPPEQQEWSSSLQQEDSEPPHIKEEQEELWSSQEGEQLQGLEEAETTKFTFTPVPVKSEDDEEKPQSSQLHHRQREQMETGADGLDSGGPGTHSDPHPETDSGPEVEVKLEDSSEPETEDSEDWEESRESGLKKKKLTEKKTKRCLSKLRSIHTGEKLFGCSNCGKRFKTNGHLTSHMVVHTGERPYSCSECGKRFTQKSSLTLHLAKHREEKPYGCSECCKRFNRKFSLTLHMVLHTGEKPFSCSECDQRFSWSTQLKRHKCVGAPEINQRRTKERREAGPGADGGDCGGPGPDPETEDGQVNWRTIRGPHSDVFQGASTLNSDRKHAQHEDRLLKIHSERESLSHLHQEAPRGAEQEDPEPRVIKEEQEEVWIGQSEIIKFTFTPVPVKREEDGEKPQSSQLHHRQREQMETGADGLDSGGPGPEEIRSEDSSGADGTVDSDFWKETRKRSSDLKPVKMSADVSGWDSVDESLGCWDPKASDGLEAESEESPDSDFWKDTRSRPAGLNSEENPDYKQPKKSKRYSCSECDKVFKSTQSVRIHTRTHTGEKPYSCTECGRRFDRRGTLTRHMLVHRGEKPFGCSVCSKTFKRKGHLARHMLVHTKEKPFYCSECGKWFRHQYNLTVHMSHHRGEKPFSCSVCQQRFLWPIHLRKHVCAGGQDQSEERREAGPEDCGGPGPNRNSGPDSEIRAEDWSEPDDSVDSDFWRETSEKLPGLKPGEVKKSRCDGKPSERPEAEGGTETDGEKDTERVS